MTDRLTNEPSAWVLEKMKQAPAYDDFGLGFKIYQRRQHLKKKPGTKGNKGIEDAALALGIEPFEYRGIEKCKSALSTQEGKKIREILNDADKVEKLAIFLEMEYDNLYRWIESAQKKISAKLRNSCSTEKKSVNYEFLTSALGKARESFAAHYNSAFQKNEFPNDVTLTLNNIDKYAQRFFKLPAIPQPLFLILNGLLENIDDVKDLDKIAVFTGSDENMCDFIETTPQFAPFMFYAANKLFYNDSPRTSFKDCFKPMSTERLATLLYIMTHNTGIYEFAQDLKALQKFHEFHTLGMQMAKLLKPHLPLNVDYDLLQKGLALQGIGTYVLYVILSPSLSEEDSKKTSLNKRKHLFYHLDEEVLDMINYDYHPAISATLASNWEYDESVVKLLFSHHETKAAAITPECAVLKLINRLVDDDFRAKSRDDLTKLLNEYPQVSIPLEALFSVVTQMDKLKDEMIRASSSMIDARSRQASQVTKEKIKTFTDKNSEVLHSGVVKIFPEYEASDFRFEPDYLMALTNECYYLLNTLNEKITTKRENETYEQFGNRMIGLQLAQDVVLYSFDTVAQKSGIPIDELKKRLKRIE